MNESAPPWFATYAANQATAAAEAKAELAEMAQKLGDVTSALASATGGNDAAALAEIVTKRELEIARQNEAAEHWLSLLDPEQLATGAGQANSPCGRASLRGAQHMAENGAILSEPGGV